MPTAPDAANNAGVVLPPMVSKQKEVGIKANPGGVLLAGAVFEIEKACEYTDANNVYGPSGRQNYQGLEVSGTGKPVDRVTRVAGATLLRTRRCAPAEPDRWPLPYRPAMGARFTTRAVGLPLTLRLNVNNVANKSHWMNSCYVGAPRGVAFSAQLQF